MPIADDVATQLTAAMRARDKARTSALRNIRAALLTAQKEGPAGGTLSDDQAAAVLRSLAKQRAESIEAFEAVGRAEAAAAERTELSVIEGFLPRLADAATTRGWVAEAIAATGAAGPSEIGKVMGHLMAAHRAELDGKLANQLVRELLAR